MFKELPILYHKAKTGKIHTWQVWTEGDQIFSEAGTQDGKKILSSKTALPKNEGKKNATTVEEQAIIEAKAMHKFKLDRKYSLTAEDAVDTEEIKPMLAQDFFKHKNKISYPVDVSAKLDGARSLSYWENEKIILKSRGGKEWLFSQHIKKELQNWFPENIVLDGELFKKDVPFNTLMSWMKREQSDNLQIQYWIYDVIDLNNLEATWLERKALLKQYKEQHTSENIQFVITEEVHSEEDLLNKTAQYVTEGYEGGMARVHTGFYESGYRSKTLLKIKNFEDGEFKIIGYTNGRGKFADQVIWICENENGLPFNVISSCTQEEKREYLKNADQYIGKLLTVQYFGKSEDDIPRFPVGKGFRLREDLN